MKIVKLFIWLGFTALLAVSIPKVAWVFRIYEGNTTLSVTLAGFSFDALWLIPLFVSICIDALTLVLTYAVSVDKARASQFSMWAFIALLCGLSYYCNLLYNDVPLRSNPFIIAVTPFILAGVPLFALCYTLILSRVEGNGETLEQKAARMESEKAAKIRIAQVKQELSTETGGLIGSLGSGIRRAKREVTSIINDGKGAGINGSKEQVKPDDSAPIEQGINVPITDVNPVDKEQNNAPITVSKEQVKPDDMGAKNEAINEVIDDEKTGDNEQVTGSLIALTPDVLPVLNAFPDIASWLTTSRKTVSINDVSTALNVSVKLVGNRVKDGTLKTAPRNDKLITIKSVLDFAKTLYSASQNESKTDGIPALKLVHNETIEQGINGSKEQVKPDEKAS